MRLAVFERTMRHEEEQLAVELVAGQKRVVLGPDARRQLTGVADEVEVLAVLKNGLRPRFDALVKGQRAKLSPQSVDGGLVFGQRFGAGPAVFLEDAVEVFEHGGPMVRLVPQNVLEQTDILAVDGRPAVSRGRRPQDTRRL